MSYRFLALMLVMLLPADVLLAQPVEPKPNDFALRIPLRTSGDNGVVQFTLPESVYQASTLPELADLRLFGEDGKSLNFHLYRTAVDADVSLHDQVATQFPIWSESTLTDQQLTLSVSTATDGSLSWTRGQPEQKPAAKLSAIILDLGPDQDQSRLVSLKFFEPQPATDYQAKIAVSRSADLQRWDLVAQNTLGWFSSQHGDQQLRQDSIAISSGSGRYLKLQWREGDPRLFGRISGRWQRETSVEAQLLSWTLQGNPGHFDNDYIYAASPAIRATEVDLQLAEPNTVMAVVIGRYDPLRQGPQRWRFHPEIQSTFYRLTHQGIERQSSSIQIHGIATSQWVLRLADATRSPPQLTLRWQAQTLVFLSPGRHTVLAVGANPDRVRQWPSRQLPLDRVAPGYSTAEIARLERAQIDSDAPVVEADASAPAGPAQASTDYDRRWMLWAVLTFGVLLLSAMSWQLYRQLNKDSASP